MIDVSAYGEEPEVEFTLPAPQPAPQKPSMQRTPDGKLPPLIFRPRVRSGKPRRPWLLTTGAFLLAMPFVGVGIILSLTVVFSIPGAIIMGIGCFPLHLLLERHSKKLDAWYNRDRPLDEDTVKPWM